MLWLSSGSPFLISFNYWDDILYISTVGSADPNIAHERGSIYVEILGLQNKGIPQKQADILTKKIHELHSVLNIWDISSFW